MARKKFKQLNTKEKLVVLCIVFLYLIAAMLVVFQLVLDFAMGVAFAFLAVTLALVVSALFIKKKRPSQATQFFFLSAITLVCFIIFLVV